MQTLILYSEGALDNIIYKAKTEGTIFQLSNWLQDRTRFLREEKKTPNIKQSYSLCENLVCVKGELTNLSKLRRVSFTFLL